MLSYSFLMLELIAIPRAPELRRPKRITSLQKQNQPLQKLSHGNHAIHFRSATNTRVLLSAVASNPRRTSMAVVLVSEDTAEVEAALEAVSALAWRRAR